MSLNWKASGPLWTIDGFCVTHCKFFRLKICFKYLMGLMILINRVGHMHSKRNSKYMSKNLFCPLYEISPNRFVQIVNSSKNEVSISEKFTILRPEN